MDFLIQWVLAVTADMGYIGVVFLMAIESSFVPLPSEVIIPPAAYLAALGQMNIYLIIICGVIGSLIGACFNYFLALTLGRKIIYALANKKIAKLFFINEEKIKKVEDYFNENSSSSTFLGRLIPGVRHLISIPAGFSQMNFRKFIFYTTLGSFIWVTVLAVLGYFFGANQSVSEKYYKQFSILLIFVGLLFGLYLLWKWRNNKSKKV